jgi:hypothetical protein
MGVQLLCQFTPKCRKMALLGKTGGTWTLNSPAQESRIEEGHPMSDHVQVDQMQ